MGKFPAPSSHNKKGRPRVMMGGYKVDGKTIPPFEVLVDDLIILGWYAEALVGCLKELIDLNGEEVKLDVIIDKLPNEQGGDDFYKATLLREICRKGSKGLLDIVGVPDNSDTLQRELLCDNIAGLLNEIVNDEHSPYRKAMKLYRFNRIIK